MKLLITFLFTYLFSQFASSQSLDYQVLFGDDWNKALIFEKENRNWMEPLLAKSHVSYPVAIAVIFPEIVRYSALRDKVEITLLKTLYVNLGEDYANFSVGQFQMKPSFAETIRRKADSVLGRKSGISFKRKSDFNDIKDFRKSILNDLEDPKSQINYLVAFIMICEKEFKTSCKDEISQIKFLATAYNFGIDKKEPEIERMTDRKFFNTKLIMAEKYCYSDVSLFWYKQFISH